MICLLTGATNRHTTADMTTKVTTIRFSPELIARAQRQAEKQGRTRTNLMVHLIDEGLRRLEKKPSAPAPAQPSDEGVFS